MVGAMGRPMQKLSLVLPRKNEANESLLRGACVITSVRQTAPTTVSLAQEYADLGTLNDRNQEGWLKGDLVRLLHANGAPLVSACLGLQ